nr:MULTISPECIES: LysR family transcriptional regulator [Streptomyces]
MLDVRRLVLLRDLAAHGTVTAVAELHRVTPSAVSQQLRLLEEETRTSLLERTGRSIHLTAAGRRLAEDTEHVLDALEQARSHLHSEAAEPAGPLHLACFPSALVPLAAPLGRALRNTHPGLRLHITEAEPEPAARLLLQRRADLALTYRYTNLADPTPSGVESHVLGVDPLVAVLPREHPAARPEGAPVELREFADSDWIGAPAHTACGTAVLHACRSAGFTPRVRHTCTDFTAMIALAASCGLPVVLPRMAAAQLPPGLLARPLDDLSLARTIEAAARRGAMREPPVAACLEAVRALVPDATGDGAIRPASP